MHFSISHNTHVSEFDSCSSSITISLDVEKALTREQMLVLVKEQLEMLEKNNG